MKLPKALAFLMRRNSLVPASLPLLATAQLERESRLVDQPRRGHG